MDISENVTSATAKFTYSVRWTPVTTKFEDRLARYERFPLNPVHLEVGYHLPSKSEAAAVMHAVTARTGVWQRWTGQSGHASRHACIMKCMARACTACMHCTDIQTSASHIHSERKQKLLAQLRCSCSPRLPVDAGCLTPTPLLQCLCPLCHAGVGDLPHVLFACPHHDLVAAHSRFRMPSASMAAFSHPSCPPDTGAAYVIACMYAFARIAHPQFIQTLHTRQP